MRFRDPDHLAQNGGGIGYLLKQAFAAGGVEEIRLVGDAGGVRSDEMGPRSHVGTSRACLRLGEHSLVTVNSNGASGATDDLGGLNGVRPRSASYVPNSLPGFNPQQLRHALLQTDGQPRDPVERCIVNSVAQNVCVLDGVPG